MKSRVWSLLFVTFVLFNAGQAKKFRGKLVSFPAVLDDSGETYQEDEPLLLHSSGLSDEYSEEDLAKDMDTGNVHGAEDETSKELSPLVHVPEEEPHGVEFSDHDLPPPLPPRDFLTGDDLENGDNLPPPLTPLDASTGDSSFSPSVPHMPHAQGSGRLPSGDVHLDDGTDIAYPLTVNDDSKPDEDVEDVKSKSGAETEAETPLSPKAALAEKMEKKYDIEELKEIASLIRNGAKDQEHKMEDGLRGVIDPKVMESIERVYFFGDIHGDPLALLNVIRMLRLSEAEKDKSLFVSTGDFMDRGPYDYELFELLKEMKEKGYKLVMVNGNHEMMVAQGDWRYRNLVSVEQRGLALCREKRQSISDDHWTAVDQCEEEIRAVLEQSKVDTLTCDGEFNSFYRTKMSPVALLRHPAHDVPIVVSHGGVSSNFLDFAVKDARHFSSATTPSLDSVISRVNEVYQEAATTVCRWWDKNADSALYTCPAFKEFNPPVNTLQWNNAISSGSFRTEERYMGGCKDYIPSIDSVWTEGATGGRGAGSCQSPSWDRSMYYSTFYAEDKDESLEACLAWMNIANDLGETNSLIQVVGHTNDDRPVRSVCSGHVFGIDSEMSRGLCRRFDATTGEGTPCDYSVLVFENFGTEEFAKNRIIYRKTIKMGEFGTSTSTAEMQCDQLFSQNTLDNGISNRSQNPAEDSWGTVDCNQIGEAVAGVKSHVPSGMAEEPQVEEEDTSSMLP